MTDPGLALVFLAILLVHAVVAFFLARWRWQRRERPPVTEKMLRAPGERLRRRLDALEERCLWLGLAATGLPLLTLVAGWWAAERPALLNHQLTTEIAALAVAVILLGGAAWLLWRAFNERRETRRRLQGERVVGESLATLVPAGYRVFHDVPTETPGPDGSIHHVVIGPAGVFSVQTQTHARRKALPGRKDHEIIFDGDQLVYPWGQDTEGIVPARNKAEWLSDLLYQIVGERVPVSAVLTFPGWWVTPVIQREVRVHNPGQIAALILQSTSDKLNPSQLDLIVRQLEIRCRDVEF